MTLSEFFNRNKLEGQTKEIVITDRIKDENGENFKFIIKPIGSDEFKDIGEKADIKKVSVDTLLVVNNCIYPNFKKKDEMKEAGFSTAVEYVNAVLGAGEVIKLANEIMNFSGFGKKDVEKDVETVKN